MKKWLLLFAMALPVYGQISNPGIIAVSTAPSGACTSALPDQQTFPGGILYSCQSGTWTQIAGGGGGGGVSSFSAGNLVPLFTTSVATATTTPALTFTITAAAANTVFGNFTGGSAAPTFSAAPVFSAALLTNFPTFNQNTTGNAATATNISTNGTANQVWGMNSGATAQGWQTVSGGGSGTVSGQASGVIPLGTSATAISNQSHLDDGNTTAATITSTEPIAVNSSGASNVTVGASGTAGTVSLGNATSGLLSIQAGTGALGSDVATLPANTGTVAETNFAQTFSASQTINNAEHINSNNADYGILAFRAKLRSIQQGNTTLQLNGVIIGDSQFGGQGITIQADMTINQFRLALQQYGIGSQVSGIVPIGENNGLAVTPFSWAITGSGWSSVNDFGPFQPNGQLGTGAFNSLFTDTVTTDTATFSGECGTQVTIVGEENSTSVGWGVTIDGGAVANALTAQPGTPTLTFSAYIVSQGCHTVVLKPLGGGTSYLYGAGITNATGVNLNRSIVLSNLSHGFARSEAFAIAPATTLAVLGITGNPDFAVIELGANDILNGPVTDTITTYTANITTLITYLQTLNPEVAILLVQPHNYVGSQLTFTSAQMQTALQALADQFNVSFLSYADAEGTEAFASALGLMNADNLHPSNQGGILEGSLLAQKFLGVTQVPNFAPQGIGVDFFPTSATPYSLPSGSTVPSGQFQVGYLWAKGSGSSSGTAFEGSTVANSYFVTNFIPNGSVFKGWKWCAYANGTPLVTPSQETFCDFLALPTVKKQISTSIWQAGSAASITGTALTATCDTATSTIPAITMPDGTVINAVVGSQVSVTPTNGTDPGGAFYYRGTVTATNTVTVSVCGTGTPPSQSYNVYVAMQQ